MNACKKLLSVVLALSMCLSMMSISAAAEEEAEAAVGSSDAVVDENTTWRYLDDNTDPAGDAASENYNAQSWTGADFDDSAWKTAAGTFGCKNGELAEVTGYTPTVLLNQYIDGDSANGDIPTVFFRTTFEVADVSAVTQLVGSVIYDDGAAVYLNGTQIAAFDIDDATHTSNLYYDGHNSSPTTGTISITDQNEIVSLLKEGTNYLAVELHQGRSTSSDLYLSVNFEASAEPVAAWEPDNLLVNIGDDESSVSVTWYDTAESAGVLNFGGKTYQASVSAAAKDGYYVNRVTVYNLQPSTPYTYSVTSGDTTSAEYIYTTTAFGDDNSFTFAAVGDPQIGASGNEASDASGWANTVQTLENDGNDYSFIFSLGDQVNTNTNETQYTYFMDALNDSANATVPLANLVGNHDNGASNYTDHYTLPNVTTYGSNLTGDGDYWFTYNNVLFMVLNSSNLSISEHKQFLENTLEANPNASWNVVCFHKSIYSTANHVTESDIVTLRNGLSPIFYERGIDVVLQGHDHVYDRTYIMGGTNGMEAQVTDEVQTDIYAPDGVQYVTLNSASGSKFYNIQNEAYTYSAVRNQEKVPNYSAVTVTDNTFTVTTYRTTDGSVVDTFTIHKSWEPENLNVNIGGSEESVSLTWYDTNADGDTLIWNGTEYPAAVTAASKDGYYINRVTVSGLESSTAYSYTITSGANTSPEYSYTTPEQGENVEFSFAAVGDPQIGASGNVETDTENWNSTMSVIEKDGTDYAFVFSLGDQINAYYDGTNGDSLENEYSGFLSAFAVGSTALATLVGNHDAGRENSTLYTEHYTMPNVTTYGQNQDGDGDYYFTYNGVLFMVLNSSNLSIADHKQFMEETIAANSNAEWKIVCFHKSIYSVASHVTESDIETLRTGLSPVLNELDVDLVLQGHDHVYARSYIMGGDSGMDACVTDTVETQINNPDGVQYVTLNSSSGSKYYKITQEAFTYTAVQNQEKVPNYSRVTISGNDLTVTTYRTTDGSVVDTFTIHKCAELVSVEAVDATCTKDGNIAYSYCEECGTCYDANGEEIEEADTVIPAASHTLAVDDAKAATCTEDGLTSGVHCSVCGEVLVAQETVPAVEHILVQIKATAATCTKNGNIAYAICETCGKLFDEAGNELDPAVTVITASGHALKIDAARAATCTESGLTAGAHCSVCGEVLIKQTTIPASGHKLKKIAAEAATYSEAGNIAYSICETCGIVLDADGKKISIEDTVIPAHVEDCPSAKFTDVKADTYYHESVDAVVREGLMIGISDTQFGTYENVTRAMAVTVLYRLAGSPAVTGTNRFTDVSDSAYYAKAVLWAQEQGIVKGRTETTFVPDQAISRQELVAILYRYAKLCGKNLTPADDLSSYTDRDQVGSWAYDAMSWAVGSGLVHGTSQTTLSPKVSTIRADFAVMMERFEELG